MAGLVDVELRKFAGGLGGYVSNRLRIGNVQHKIAHAGMSGANLAQVFLPAAGNDHRFPRLWKALPDGVRMPDVPPVMKIVLPCIFMELASCQAGSSSSDEASRTKLFD